MSGAQGAQPPGSFTATTYESVEGGENKTKTSVREEGDQGGIQIDKIQDKVQDAAGLGGPVFGPGKGDEDDSKGDQIKQDLGVTGTA
ncbi:hypothetical protein Sjap_023930 [Stephania japonica]|uniref:Seed maturation protein PM41 n=1 Tax=Stephania japonica TaxID=461633 RepID=A0AAP0EHT6_9MAGN